MPVGAADLDNVPGLRWHEGMLWFSDMYNNRILTMEPSGKTKVVCWVPNRPSGLGFTPDGALLIVSMLDRKLLRFDSRGFKTVADISKFCGGDANDMVVDGKGRAYIGNLGFSPGQDFKTTYLVLVNPDGSSRRVGQEMHLPNGCAITPDGKTIICAESRGHRLTAYTIAPDGSLTDKRLYAELGEGVVPDGICLDAEGAVWVGAVTNNVFLRVLPGGKVTDRIPVPGKYAVACVLGGAGRRTLFLCTAKTTREDLAQGKSIGWIETVRVPVPGAGVP